MGTLMLLDTATLYYRAFYGMPETVTAPDGTPVNAIRGLLDAIGRLVREHQPARLIACLDADWRPAFRVAAIPSYKAHRAEEDGQAISLRLYDPNWPDRDDVTVTIHLDNALRPTGLSQSTGEPLLGWFVLPYSPAEPRVWR